jgi:hypothetical protein
MDLPRQTVDDGSMKTKQLLASCWLAARGASLLGGSPSLLVALLLATGCAESQRAAAPVKLSQHLVTINGDEPFVRMPDETKMAVDGVSPGESAVVSLVTYRNGDERRRWRLNP